MTRSAPAPISGAAHQPPRRANHPPADARRSGTRNAVLPQTPRRARGAACRAVGPESFGGGFTVRGRRARARCAELRGGGPDGRLAQALRRAPGASCRTARAAPDGAGLCVNRSSRGLRHDGPRARGAAAPPAPVGAERRQDACGMRGLTVWGAAVRRVRVGGAW